jgi:tetratricopeptide (TPR) repeat protein
LVKAKAYDAAAMYDGAYAYFMLNDYDRAAQWVDNTLQYAPDHIAARILLARLCILQDRTDDGLAVFDFILSHYGAGLTDGQRKSCDEILSYYGRNDALKLKEQYPHIASFLGLLPSEPSDKADAGQATAEVPVAGSTAKADEDSTQALPAVEEALHSIKAADVSLGEKVNIYNKFAGAYFMQDDLVGAEHFLDEAEKLEAHDELTLQNHAILAKLMGDREKALAYAAKSAGTDFRLLAALK